MGDRQNNYDNRVTDSKGVLIGDSVRVDSLTFNETQNLTEEAAHFAKVGAIHLQQRCYEEAADALRKAVVRSPGDSLTHLYLAVALLANRRPRSLLAGQVKVIERSLEKALSLDPPDGRAALTLAFVRYDYYLLNHRRPRGATVEELISVSFEQGLGHARLDSLTPHLPWLHFLKAVLKGRKSHG